MEPKLLLREALTRIQTEYVEMPDMKLTARQVQRLWSLPTDISEAALAALITRGFLSQSADGAYVRQVGRRIVDPRGN